MRKVRVTRDSILFAFGLAGITYETVVEHIERPSLLILFGTMIGSPFFLRRDEKHAPLPTPPPEEAKK